MLPGDSKQHNCKEKRKYNNYFDSYFCKECDLWLEKTCGATEITRACYCAIRPEKPSMSDKK
jgi:hypothetical protein